MIGNTWEWTSTVFGTDKQTKQPQYTLRGGSYVDSVDGTFNHKADVTTRYRIFYFHNLVFPSVVGNMSIFEFLVVKFESLTCEQVSNFNTGSI